MNVDVILVQLVQVLNLASSDISIFMLLIYCIKFILQIIECNHF